jgi:CubicO group peptidase (beta-lactamase class C family)
MKTDAFPRVIEEFARQLSNYPLGTGAALAVYLDENLIVDEWGGESAPGVPWQSGTMAVTFSATKGVATSTLLSLAPRTGLEVDRPLAHYWPAFGESGKETITVTEMLSHRAGLPYWDAYPEVVTAESPAITWLREDVITASLAESPVVAGARGKFAYHAVTLGWLIHGLVRALTGVSLSEMFTTTFAAPYGLEYYLGLPPEHSDRVARLLADPPLSVDPADPDPEQTAKSLLRSANGVDYLHNIDLINSSFFHAVPQGACNGIGTARGLAGVYVALDNLNLGPTRHRITGSLLRIPGPGPRREQGLGYQVRMPTPWNDVDTAFGHTGAGGGVGFYDPVHRLAFALVTNHMNFGTDERVNQLRAAIAADLGR